MNHVRPQKARAALHLQRLEAGGVFLDREVGNGGSQVEAGREAERRKRIVRRHLDVMRLGQRRDLPRAGDAAAERHVDARVLRPAPREEGAEVVQGGVALARRDRRPYPARDPRHGVHVLQADRVLAPERQIALDAGDEVHRLGRGQAAMELQQEVDVVPQRLAHPAHGLHRAGHVAHMGPGERPALVLVEERVDVAHGVEARLLEGRAIRHQLR